MIVGQQSERWCLTGGKNYAKWDDYRLTIRCVRGKVVMTHGKRIVLMTLGKVWWWQRLTMTQERECWLSGFVAALQIAPFWESSSSGKGLNLNNEEGRKSSVRQYSGRLGVGGTSWHAICRLRGIVLPLAPRTWSYRTLRTLPMSIDRIWCVRLLFLCQWQLPLQMHLFRINYGRAKYRGLHVTGKQIN